MQGEVLYEMKLKISPGVSCFKHLQTLIIINH